MPPINYDELVERLRAISDLHNHPESQQDCAVWQAAEALKTLLALNKRMEEALRHARGAIGSLPEDALGFHEPMHEEDVIWPLRDELLHMIDAALPSQENADG